MRISDWSSDVCSSDLRRGRPARDRRVHQPRPAPGRHGGGGGDQADLGRSFRPLRCRAARRPHLSQRPRRREPLPRSEEHTSELQSLMRISYAVFCLKKKNKTTSKKSKTTTTLNITRN